jgi:hypothetical protein
MALKQYSFLGNGSINTFPRQRIRMQQQRYCWKRCFLFSPCKGVIRKKYGATESVVFLDPRANAELVPKFHVALHASHAALPLVISKFGPKIAPPPNASSKFYYNSALRLHALPIPEGQAGTAWKPSIPEI